MNELSKKQNLNTISSIRDKQGNEIFYRSGTNPDDELYLWKYNQRGDIIYKGKFIKHLKDGLHTEFDENKFIKSQAYYKDDKPIAMPNDIQLWIAIEKGNLDEVKDAITYHPELLNLTSPKELQSFPASDDKEAYSVLEKAIRLNKTEIANFLVDSGAKLQDYSITHSGYNKQRQHDPLGLAIQKYNSSLINKMLAKDPSILKMQHVELLNSIKDKININSLNLKHSLSLANDALSKNKKLKM